MGLSTDIRAAGGGKFGFVLRHPDSAWLQYLTESDRVIFAMVRSNENIGAFLKCMKKSEGGARSNRARAIGKVGTELGQRSSH